MENQQPDSRHATPTAQENLVSPIEQETDRPQILEVNTTSQAAVNTPSSRSSENGNVGVPVSPQSTETATPSSKFSLKRETLRRWTTFSENGPKIHWYTPTTMVILSLCGFFGALGHHLYNSALHGQEVKDSEWPQRWGIALAFFVKMTLIGAVQSAFKQLAWLTVRKRGFRVKTLDSLFQSCYDPLEFFDKELVTRAFLPTLLALLAWILPLSAIASPSTLTASNIPHNETATCLGASTLDFNLENGFGIWRREPDVNKQGSCFWDDWIRPNTAFYNQPSMDARRLFQLAMLSKEPLQPQSPCPSDSNCTYSLSFHAPAYKCENRDDFGGSNQLYKMSQMVPFGNLTYASYSSEDEDTVGRPQYWDIKNVTEDTGVFHKEPTLWVSWVWNSTLPVTPENATQWNTASWSHQWNTHVMECTLWNSSYSYTLSYLQGKMNVTESTVRHDHVLLAEGQVKKPDDDNYMEFSAFHGTAFLYRQMLLGNFTQPRQDTWMMTESAISQTSSILDPGSGFAYEEDLRPYVEKAFQNIYLSYLSNDVQVAQRYHDVTCEVSKHVLSWNYDPTWLAVSYFVAVGLTLVAIGVGMRAILRNGYVAQTNFSTFLATTRNKDLDSLLFSDVGSGSSLGAWPMKKEFRQTRLRFGEVVREEDETSLLLPHAAFGFEERVKGIEKGKQYA
ncbi:hypothetical protein QBC38DRAFT_455389 [Podospora fimiseda]|uniref:Uncharacterized protein n=1 Tax=Podospora fimiseda TaxID=252190 RepID=A0AAN7BPU2_9PEZI|nr:hypothetical protein QBC38DRAFT_455389 [Podospora fimiseda]